MFRGSQKITRRDELSIIVVLFPNGLNSIILMILVVDFFWRNLRRKPLLIAGRVRESAREVVVGPDSCVRAVSRPEFVQKFNDRPPGLITN